MSAQRGERLGSVNCLSGLHLTNALAEGLVEPLALLGVEVVATVRENIIDRHQLDDFALGEIGGLVEDEASVLHMGSERLHHVRV